MCLGVGPDSSKIHRLLINLTYENISEFARQPPLVPIEALLPYNGSCSSGQEGTQRWKATALGEE